MKDFPPIYKKDPLDVQMYFIKDHFEATNKVIRLEDVPEEMYVGALPLAKGRKSKRKLTAEEYLEAEKPAKKAKAASDKLKIGDSAMPSIEKVATFLVVPDQPTIPKKKRKPAIRRIKESTVATSEVVEAAEKALEITTELQEISTSEAENLLLSASKSVQKDFDAKSEEVVNVPSDSSSLPLSSTLSSSSDSDDDKPIGQRFLTLLKSHPTSTKSYKKPSQTSSYEPVGHVIDQKLEEMSERRNQYIDRILLHHPQPLNIQTLNIISPEEVNLNSGKAFETASEAVASDKVVSESPQQHTPEPQKTSSPQQQPTNTHIYP
jgi:hypothetical protein